MIRLRWAARSLSSLLVLAGWMAAATPALGEQIVEQEGIVGHAGLADIQDSPGAACTFTLPGPGSIGETIVQVNPPVIFAADITPETDRQPVGWRAHILAYDPIAQDWVQAAESPLYLDDSSDQIATYFGGGAWSHTFLLASGTFSAGIELFWFDPAQPDVVTGHMDATIERYAVLLRSNATTVQAGVHALCKTPDRGTGSSPSAPVRPG